MKTTLEIPDDLFRRAKATAAMRGQALRELVSRALEAHLEQVEGTPAAPRGWRTVFGRADRQEVAEVDAAVGEEFERVDGAQWR